MLRHLISFCATIFCTFFSFSQIISGHLGYVNSTSFLHRGFDRLANNGDLYTTNGVSSYHSKGVHGVQAEVSADFVINQKKNSIRMGLRYANRGFRSIERTNIETTPSPSLYSSITEERIYGHFLDIPLTYNHSLFQKDGFRLYGGLGVYACVLLDAKSTTLHSLKITAPDGTLEHEHHVGTNPEDWKSSGSWWRLSGGIQAQFGFQFEKLHCIAAYRTGPLQFGNVGVNNFWYWHHDVSFTIGYELWSKISPRI